ncbi:hypothetical protein [Allorhizocola rhizosphaerae]|uniref:hypothetical protein n=1 Tax=Allorhizocola rhizosphaerae TaxID=1872709 RepID=UPI0013C30C1F|nr:hypothetical protein [Allorhizocola rhizosphaerae]
MLWALQEVGVSEVWLDARRPRQNKADNAAIAAWRAQRVLAPDLRVEFVHAEDEPLLWMADIVAGAAGAAHWDNDDRYIRPLDGIVETIPLRLE